MARLQIIPVYRLGRNNIRLQCLELSNNMLQELNMEKKAWHANNKDKEQNSLNELITKINRKDGRIHANMASDMTDSDTENNNTWQEQR